MQLGSVSNYVLKSDNSIKSTSTLVNSTKIEELNAARSKTWNINLNFPWERYSPEKLNKQTSYNKDYNKIEYLVKQVNVTYSKVKKKYMVKF